VAEGRRFASWCETGWYSSPAVADLDRDGTPEVIGSAYSIVALDGRTGALEWRLSSGHDRSQPGASNVGPHLARDRPPPTSMATAGLEIASGAISGGWVRSTDAQGYFQGVLRAGDDLRAARPGRPRPRRRRRAGGDRHRGDWLATNT